MKEIILAKTAGFCFGVNRAVKLVYELIEKKEAVCTLGPIIHNPQLVKELENQGVRIINDPKQVRLNETLVIRSHGVAQDVMDCANEMGIKILDATCPFVAKIHKIVCDAGKSGRTVLIAGDKNHKEVVGIVGHCSGKNFVFADEKEAEKLIFDQKISKDTPVTIVAQTTFNNELWNKCKKTFKKVYTNQIVFDTICNATFKRQAEAKQLSACCDAMIVVGGAESSNTKKLNQVCKQYCENTFLIETVDELDLQKMIQFNRIGVVAGASTPAFIIEEVIKTMSENVTSTESQELNFDEMSFEEALEASLSNFNTDQKVKGYVLAVGPTEIQVDIGRKHAGFVSASEYSNDPNVNLMEEVKVGDVLDLIVMKTNDQEGTVMLSKRRFDAIAGWDKIISAKENRKIIHGTVSDVIKGGIIVYYEGIRVFIPASQATLSRGDSLEQLKGTTISFRIIETGRGRKAIGSAKYVLREEKKAAQAKIWENIAVGDKFTGTVKSITGYGAFVDIGGIDGMVHISELSWQKIKNPSEVVSVGDQIEVYIKDIDTENKKISLGYKKADENPWLIFKQKYFVDDIVEVEIVSLKTYGAFARIIPGVDGLIHISQITNRHINKPADELSVGQKISAKIIEINLETKRVSLSIKALLPQEDVLESVISDDESLVEQENLENEAE